MGSGTKLSHDITSHPLTQYFSDAVTALRQRLPRRWRPPATDPSAALFQRIRLRLILWYASVLAVVLLLVGGLLYFDMQQTVMGPVNDYLTYTANRYATIWQRAGPPCFPARFDPDKNVPYIACYDDTGHGIGAEGLANEAPGFLNASLAQRALEDGAESDVVDSGNGNGAISRYALVVRDPDSHQILGVIQIGVLTEGQLAAMHALLQQLLILLPLALVGATIGGFFLAERALTPARLAFERQQTFIADASHELRTPLALLRANADVLLRGRGRFDPDDVSLLEDIVGETEHLTSIANSLLTLARLDSGATRLERDVVDLADIARQAAHRVDALSHERGITVQLGELTSVAVLGDAQLLAQATMALLDNALKYGGSGSEITLTTARDGDHGTLTVHDTGPGIAPEHLPLLGQRFYRPDKARSRAAGGAGLGLSVVRGIVALHHGTLIVNSAPGEGTSAILRIPAISPNDRSETAPASDTATQRA